MRVSLGTASDIFSFFSKTNKVKRGSLAHPLDPYRLCTEILCMFKEPAAAEYLCSKWTALKKKCDVPTSIFFQLKSQKDNTNSSVH